MPFVLAFVLAVFLTPVARRAGLGLRLVDVPSGSLKIHRQPIPVLGGAAVLAAILGTIAASDSGWPPGLGVVVVGFVVGFVDDVRPLPATLRLAMHALMGGVVALSIPVDPLSPFGGVLTVFIVVALINASNMLDGQDGLAGGLGAIASLSIGAAAVTYGASSNVALAVAGALAGFLVWNRPPARIFLGNGGAYALGCLLALLTVDLISRDGWRGLLVAGMCVGAYVFEFSFTVIRRLINHNGMVGGDRQHSYDLLAEEVGDRGKVTVIFCGIAAVAGAVGVLVTTLPMIVVGTLSVAAALTAATWGMFLWGRSAGGMQEATDVGTGVPLIAGIEEAGSA